MNHETGRDVRHAHGRFSPVDVLAAGAAGAENIHFDVVRFEIDFDVVVDLRVNENRGERSVAARVGIERRNADQAMHADFRLQQAVNIFSVDFKRHGFDAGAFTFQPVRHDSLEVRRAPPTLDTCAKAFRPNPDFPFHRLRDEWS